MGIRGFSFIGYNFGLYVCYSFNGGLIMLSLNDVKQVLDSKGIAYPYPRKGCIAINGGRLQPASKQAIQYARDFYKLKRGV
jgi:hypothetical protein